MAATTTNEDDRPADWGTDPEDLPAEIQTMLAAEPTDTDLSLDEIFGLLKNQRRRDVLQYLRTTEDGTATLDTLAEHIAAKENDIPISQLSSDQRKRVYIGLYQCHLPKMDDVGVVDYDQNRGTVALCETISQFEPYLPDDGEEPDSATRRSLAELGIAGVVVTGATGGALGLGPLAAIPALAWAVVSTVALAAGALYQLVTGE